MLETWKIINILLVILTCIDDQGCKCQMYHMIYTYHKKIRCINDGFFHPSVLHGMISEWYHEPKHEPIIHNTVECWYLIAVDQCQEFWVNDIIRSSFPVAWNDEKSVVDTPSKYFDVIHISIWQIIIMISIKCHVILINWLWNISQGWCFSNWYWFLSSWQFKTPIPRQ